MKQREIIHDELTLAQLQSEVGTFNIFPLNQAELAIVQPTAVPEVGVLIFLDNEEVNSLTWARFRLGQNGDSQWSVPFSVACLCGKCPIEPKAVRNQTGKEPVSLIQVVETIEQIALDKNLQWVVVDSTPRDVLSNRINFLKGINTSYLEKSLEEFAGQRGVPAQVICEQLGFVTGTIGRSIKQSETHHLSYAA